MLNNCCMPSSEIRYQLRVHNFVNINEGVKFLANNKYNSGFVQYMGTGCVSVTVGFPILYVPASSWFVSHGSWYNGGRP